MAKEKFTAGRIDDYRCEDGKQQSFLWDATAPGLALRATANGVNQRPIVSSCQRPNLSSCSG